MKGHQLAIAILAVGVVLFFIGDKLANVGDTVDRIIASKWTAIAVAATGGLLLFSKRIERIAA